MSDLVLPLPQSHEFERCCALLNLTTHRQSWSKGTCLVQTRTLPLLGSVNLISRGPISPRSEDQAGRITDLVATLKGPVLLNLERGPRPSRAWRLMDGKTLAVLRLIEPGKMRARLSQKWRNQLKKAERSSLTVVDQPLDKARHNWFLTAEAEQQKSRGYRSHPTGFLLAYAQANRGQARVLTVLENGTPIAAVLIFKHGRMATYQAGVTTARGRQLNAHNLLLWQAMCRLQQLGFTELDLGRLDLAPGLAHFKRGTGAAELSLSGSYILHPRFLRRPAKTSPTRVKAIEVKP